MMKRTISVSLVVLLVLAAALFTGCVAGKSVFVYQQQKYNTAQEALAAQQAVLNRSLDDIGRSGNPRGGSAMVFLPTEDYIRANFIKVDPRFAAQHPDHVAYGLKATQDQYQYVPDSLKRRGIFDEVVVSASGNPDEAAFFTDYAIFPVLDSGSNPQWAIKDKYGTKKLIPINNSITDLTERTLDFLDHLETAAHECH